MGDAFKQNEYFTENASENKQSLFSSKSVAFSENKLVDLVDRKNQKLYVLDNILRMGDSRLAIFDDNNSKFVLNKIPFQDKYIIKISGKKLMIDNYTGLIITVSETVDSGDNDKFTLKNSGINDYAILFNNKSLINNSGFVVLGEQQKGNKLHNASWFKII